MVDGNKLGDVGFEKIGTPYSEMDCQAFVEWCFRKCGYSKDLAGSNAWYRYILQHGAIMTPEECVRQLGTVPKGAVLFILENNGGEPAKYKPDGLGNASHMGLSTGTRGKGAIASSKSRGGVAESEFHNKSIKGGWNRVGLPDFVAYDYGAGSGTENPPAEVHPTIRRGSKGTEVAYCQAILMDLGYDLQPYGADGDFGRKTEEAVRQFQRDHRNDFGLTEDGIVGPMTWNALENADVPRDEDRWTVVIPDIPTEDKEALLSVYPQATATKGNG